MLHFHNLKCHLFIYTILFVVVWYIHEVKDFVIPITICMSELCFQRIVVGRFKVYMALKKIVSSSLIGSWYTFHHAQVPKNCTIHHAQIQKNQKAIFELTCGNQKGTLGVTYMEWDQANVSLVWVTSNTISRN